MVDSEFRIGSIFDEHNKKLCHSSLTDSKLHQVWYPQILGFKSSGKMAFLSKDRLSSKRLSILCHVMDEAIVGNKVIVYTVRAPLLPALEYKPLLITNRK